MSRIKVIASALAVLPLLAGAAPATEKAARAKEKKERATVTLPVIVDAPSDPERSYTFKEREFWGWQNARYRSAVILEAAVPVPELGPGAGLAAGARLVELQAKSRGFDGSFYCGAQVSRNPKVTPTLLCLADRDGDGAMDQLWTGAVASLDYLVPYPDVRSRRTIAPVRVAPVLDHAALALQLGFFVSGTNPIFGTHHFYLMLSKGGELGFPFLEQKKSVTLSSLPQVFGIAGAQLRVESFANETYRARVIRPFPAGERLLETPPTVFISVPG